MSAWEKDKAEKDDRGLGVLWMGMGKWHCFRLGGERKAQQ